MKTTKTLGEWLARASGRLSAASDAAGIESQAIAAFVLGTNRAWLLAHAELELEGHQIVQLDQLLARLMEGEPLPYITGRQEFYGLSFTVTPDVLIPRPETEMLVDESLRWLAEFPHRRKAADVGTGSGCIAVSLAKFTPGLHILATDWSAAALEVAARNAEFHHVREQIRFSQMDLLAEYNEPLDLVCANLPYIPDETVKVLPVGRYEPHSALAGGADGLDLIRRLVDDAKRWLSPGGLLLLEIEERQGSSVLELASNAMPDAMISLHQDLAGKGRMVRMERAG